MAKNGDENHDLGNPDQEIKIQFETRAIPGIIFDEFAKKYGQGNSHSIKVGNYDYQMVDIVVAEKICAGYLGLTQVDPDRFDSKTMLVVWAWKPQDKGDYGTQPTEVLRVVCGPMQTGSWDCSRGSRYENTVYFGFPPGGYRASFLAAKLAAMVHLRACELLHDARFEKTQPFYVKS